MKSVARLYNNPIPEARIEPGLMELFDFTGPGLPLESCSIYRGKNILEAAKKLSLDNNLKHYETDNADPDVPPEQRVIDLRRANLKYCQIGINYANIPLRVVFDEPISFYNITIPLANQTRIQWDNKVTVVNPGEACLNSVHQRYILDRPAGQISVVIALTQPGYEHFIPAHAIEGHKPERPFSVKLDITAPKFRTATQLIGLICRELDSENDSNARQDAVIASLEEAFWYSLLDACDELNQQTMTDTESHIPRYILDGIDYINNHSEDTIHTAELARHCNVSERKLQNGFRDYIGLSPTGYSRRTRLLRVHNELCQPTANYVVSEVAAKWGFYHLGNFAKYYRDQFGELPSETIKRARNEG